VTQSLSFNRLITAISQMGFSTVSNQVLIVLHYKQTTALHTLK